MAFSDVFYPGNPKKRVDVISKVQKVYVLMEQNFNATNDLITFLNTNVHPSPNIASIAVDKNGTFATNAHNLINKMHEIQAQVDKIDANLSKELEPTVYQQLTSDNTDFQAKLDLFKNLKLGLETSELVITSIAGFLVIREVVATARLIAVIAGLSEILVASFAGVIVGLFIAGAAIAVDAIISAIVGAVERSKLNDMEGELDGILAKFATPSEEYSKKIFEVLGILHYLLGQPL